MNEHRQRFPLACREMAIILLAGTLLANAQSQDNGAKTVNLRPKFEAGRTARYKFWTRREVQRSTSIGPESHSINSKAELDGEITWSVKQVHDDNSASCTMTLEWISYAVTDPRDGSVKENDSRNESGDIESLHQMLVTISGVPLTFEVSTDGRVQSVSGTDAMRNGAENADQLPSDLEFIESATDLAMLTAAPEQIVPDDEWTADFAWNYQVSGVELGKIHHHTTFTLKSIEEVEGIALANVHSQTVLSIEPDFSSLPPGAPEPDIQLMDGNVKSQIVYDLTRHEAVGRNTVETRQVKLTAQFGEQRIVTQLNERIHSQVLRVNEQ